MIEKTEMKEKAKIIAELLKILANENRLMILCALIKQPLSVGEIGKNIDGITQSALSQHLALLKAYGIISSQKKGQSIIYSISDSRVEKLIDTLKLYFCNAD